MHVCDPVLPLNYVLHFLLLVDTLCLHINTYHQHAVTFVKVLELFCFFGFFLHDKKHSGSCLEALKFAS